MKLFPQSNFNDGHTILQKLQALSKFLHDHPVYNSFFINSPWQQGASNVQYSNNAILNLADRKVSVGDLVLFNNAYYGVITNVGDGTFIVGTAISFSGPKGETGPAGQNGANGENGVGISSIRYKDATDEGNVYIITMTDGSTYEITAPKGPQGNTGATGATGPQGETGNGIANVTYQSSSASGNVYRINFTDGTYYDFTAPKGPTGLQGEQGEIGLTGLAVTIEITSSSEPTFNSTEVVAFANFNREPKLNEGLTFFVYYNNIHYLVSGYISSVDNSTSTAVISINNAVNIGVVISNAIVRTTQHESDTDVYSCNFLNNLINQITAELNEVYIHNITFNYSLIISGESVPNKFTFVMLMDSDVSYEGTNKIIQFFTDLDDTSKVMIPFYIPSQHVKISEDETNMKFTIFSNIDIDSHGVLSNIQLIINSDKSTGAVSLSKTTLPNFSFINTDFITSINDKVFSFKGSVL